jgi:uncharacterized protein YndB with AHSA1/START domain
LRIASEIRNAFSHKETTMTPKRETAGLDAKQPLWVTQSISVTAPAEEVWKILVSPTGWKDWMLVKPEQDVPGPLAVGSRLLWRNEDGDIYLTGTLTALDVDRRIVIELQDVSWKRRGHPGEVTYSFCLSEHRGRTTIDFALGDLSIDPEAEKWHRAYSNSGELEAIKAIVEV